MTRLSMMTALCAMTLAFSACSDDDTTPTPTPDSTVSGDAAAGAVELTVDITYPADAIAATGEVAAVVVYDKANYPDLNQPPAGMPIAALLGAEGQNSISGKILDLAQNQTFVFEAGKAYVIAAGVAAAGGMPTYLDNTYWVAKEVTLQAADSLTIASDDSGWAQ